VHGVPDTNVIEWALDNMSPGDFAWKWREQLETASGGVIKFFRQTDTHSRTWFYVGLPAARSSAGGVEAQQ
jgi:hypothetical protein